MSNSTRERVIELAREWLGTPWVHHQRCKGYGVDCVQLTVDLGEKLGVDYGQIDNYYRSPEGDSLYRKLAESMIEIPIEDAQPGDVLLFRVRRVPHHVGIKTGETTMIHADMRCGRVVEHEIGYYAKHLVAAFQVPDQHKTLTNPDLL